MDHQEMNSMNRRTTLTLTALAFLCLGIALPPGDALGQEKTLKQLIDYSDNIAMPTKNELNITTTKPIPDPTMGAFVPHINFKRVK